MSKTILIGANNEFTAKANKWLFTLTGLLFLVNGGFNIYNYNSLQPLGLILGLLMLVGGLYYVFYGVFGFSQNSKLAPKVKIDETNIELKNSLWKSSETLKWTDISSIKFQPYEIIFHLRGSSNSFSYNYNSDVSRTIKQSIKELAERKNIEVTGQI